jgi:hypothetical protein
VGQKVILYELNEVPWVIIDRYLSAHPRSSFARMLRVGQSYTTMNADPKPLAPWNTWPTLHTSTYTAEHNSYNLGQDPATFRGTPIWDAADASGRSVGLFGPLQTWPPKQFRSGGFHVPDTFATDANTNPASLTPFQAFNLRMTQENGFSADRGLSPSTLAKGGVSMVRNGLRPRSTMKLARHLVGELRDRREKSGRAMMQVVPSFDLYWKLHRSYQPDLSIFFTNHVAAMMHRFWGDYMAEYSSKFDYNPDPVQATLIPRSLDLTDEHLGVLMAYADRHPDTRIVVAASMGQGPIKEMNTQSLRLLEKPRSLMQALGFPEAQDGLAMYPMGAVQLPDEALAKQVSQLLGQILDTKGEPLFVNMQVRGRSVIFRTDVEAEVPEGEDEVTIVDAAGERRRLSYSDVGLVLRSRLGGGNTAYHIPQGMMLTYQAGDRPLRDRQEIDILDVAPSLLKNVLDVEVPAGMRGKVVPGLFTSSGPLAGDGGKHDAAVGAAPAETVIAS